MLTSSLQFSHVVAFVVLTIALAQLALGGLVFMDSARRTVNRLFFIFACLFFLAGVSYIGLNYSNNVPVTNAWWFVHTISLLFVPPVFYHLVLGSLGNASKNDDVFVSYFFERVKQLAYVFSSGWLLLMVLSVAPTSFTRLKLFATPTIGNQFWIAALSFGFLLALSIYLLIRNVIAAKDPTQKSRLMYVLFGASVLLIGSISSIIGVTVSDVSAGWGFPLLDVAACACVVLIAYSLTTSHLYHFSELLRKTVAFVVMAVVLLMVFGGTHYLAGRLLMPYLPNSDLFVAWIIVDLHGTVVPSASLLGSKLGRPGFLFATIRSNATPARTLTPRTVFGRSR